MGVLHHSMIAALAALTALSALTTAGGAAFAQTPAGLHFPGQEFIAPKQEPQPNAPAPAVTPAPAAAAAATPAADDADGLRSLPAAPDKPAAVAAHPAIHPPIHAGATVEQKPVEADARPQVTSEQTADQHAAVTGAQPPEGDLGQDGAADTALRSGYEANAIEPSEPRHIASAPTRMPTCANRAGALGVSRIVEIDTSGGPIYGTVSRYTPEVSFLRDKEVVLTFDDGPSPAITNSVLATLERFCTKATFFMVGRMALAYPETVRHVLGRGHTVASHTMSHPLSLNRLEPRAAIAEIERGFAAVTLAAGQPIAPLFRFPGLGDGKTLLTYLKGRKVATISVDVISNDSFISSTAGLIKTTIDRVEHKHGGIILFHDIKAQTAKALPEILRQLKARGYRVVHMRSKHRFAADPTAIAGLKTLLTGRNARKEGHQQSPTLALAAAPATAASFSFEHADGPPVTVLAPPLRSLVVKQPEKAKAARTPVRKPVERPTHSARGWSASVQKAPGNGG